MAIRKTTLSFASNPGRQIYIMYIVYIMYILYLCIVKEKNYGNSIKHQAKEY
jgi:hypothetical protein